MKRLKSRKFWFGVAGKAAGLYLISKGYVEEGSWLLGGSVGGYLVAQGAQDTAREMAAKAVRKAMEDFSE